MFQIIEEQINALLLIPCFNEEKNIKNILKHLVNVKIQLVDKRGFNLDILIIDDGSTDKTKKILDKNHNKLDFEVLRFEENKGYGYVLRKGFKFSKEYDYDWVISFDMDGQHEPKCLYRFIDQILQNEERIEIISGTRYKDPNLFRQNPWKDRFLVNTIITGILNCNGFSLTDTFCGMKAYWVNCINELELKINGYEMPLELWIIAQEKNFKIKELSIPVIYKDRDKIMKTYRKIRKRSFLFKKGEERLEKYLEIIRSLKKTALKSENNCFINIFSQNFIDLDEINKNNFQEIQKSIFDQIREMEMESG
ncbi:MAG: glycosyltransferase family 2 protein [Promethearchaeota archaeon]